MQILLFKTLLTKQAVDRKTLQGTKRKKPGQNQKEL